MFCKSGQNSYFEFWLCLDVAIVKWIRWMQSFANLSFSLLPQMDLMKAVVCNLYICFDLYFDLRWNFNIDLRWRPRSRNLSCSQRTNLSGQLFLFFISYFWHFWSNFSLSLNTYLRTFQNLLSGVCPLRGGGVPPFQLSVFGQDDCPLRGGRRYPPIPLRKIR